MGKLMNDPHRLLPQMTPTFIPWPNGVNSVFADQTQHIIKPVEEYANKFLITPDGRQSMIICPPGSGKTTMIIVDLLWRIAVMAKDKDSQLFVITTPDKGVTEDIYDQLCAIFKDKYLWNTVIKDAGIRLQGVYENGTSVLGRDLEIVVCNNQLLQFGSVHHEHLKKFEITTIFSDEAHRGLGCPEGMRYTKDIGHDNPEYEAKWYWAFRDLNYLGWFGLTGTPTESQLNDTKNYQVISKDMERSEWRLPFFHKTFESIDGDEDDVENVFLQLAERNAIGKYLKNQIDLTKLSPENKLSETKLTAILRCTQSNSTRPGLKIHQCQEVWERLTKKYKNETFLYNDVELIYSIGELAIMTSNDKTGGSNNETVQYLNDEDNPYTAVAVIHIGGVGINITNLGIVCVLNHFKNKGNVSISPEQLMSRLDRCKFQWRGPFADDVSKIKDKGQRDLMIKLAVNTSSKQVFAKSTYLVRTAYANVLPNHVMVDEAEGYLKGVISTFREHNGNSSISGTERDLSYKNARKDRCEHPNCNCYDELVENSNKFSKPIREIHYQLILQVDHKDGDRENMNPDNLITLCPNRHSIKTMRNEDYLNNYTKEEPTLIRRVI